jgi:hypothetical protein
LDENNFHLGSYLDSPLERDATRSKLSLCIRCFVFLPFFLSQQMMMTGLTDDCTFGQTTFEPLRTLAMRSLANLLSLWLLKTAAWQPSFDQTLIRLLIWYLVFSPFFKGTVCLFPDIGPRMFCLIFLPPPLIGISLPHI